jgi:hypothetical protein
MAYAAINPAIAITAARERRRHGANGEVRTQELLCARGHQVEIKTLRAAEGGLEACVVPLNAGRYRFVCDDAAGPAEPMAVGGLRDPRQFRVSFRLAHELAHTTLGRMTFGSRRGDHASSAVEVRCDEFAVLFLVDPSEALEAVEHGDAAVHSFAQHVNVPPDFVRIAATYS